MKKESLISFDKFSISDQVESVTHPLNNTNSSISLNPGKNYKIQSNDILYFISTRKDENYRIKKVKVKRRGS